MPFVRISLCMDWSQEIIDQISLCIHESLIVKFLIPQNDYFHVIEKLNKNQMKYPEKYLGITHSDKIIFIQIIAGSGRTEEQKRELYIEIGKRISASTEILINDIIIILIENGTYHNWSFGNGEIQKPVHLKY